MTGYGKAQPHPGATLAGTEVGGILQFDLAAMVFENAAVWPTPEGVQRRCPPPHSTYGFQKLSTEYYAQGAREQYGLPWGTAQQRAFRVAVAAVPKVVKLTPPVLRVWPLPGHNVTLTSS